MVITFYRYSRLHHSHAQRNYYVFQNAMGKVKEMKFEYTVTKDEGEAEIMQAMSWKKLFKKLLMKYPEFSGWCTYINKKGHVQVRAFKKGKETKK